MGMDSKISWTNHTFNPWRGCSMVHEGCVHCYALRESIRFPAVRGVWGPASAGGTRIKATLDTWKEPVRWNRKAEAAGVRARVFCASLADVFEDWAGQVQDHNGLPLWMSAGGDWIEANHNQPHGLHDFLPLTLDHLRAELFAVIDATPWLDWLLLTKRPENILRYWPTDIDQNAAPEVRAAQASRRVGRPLRYRDNVWLGTSVSLQKHTPFLDELVKCRELSPVLFCSAEPLLSGTEGLDLSHYLCIERDRPRADGSAPWRRSSKFGFEPLLDWVITGGESGPKARAMHPYGPTELQRQCKAAGVPFHFKQWGEYLPVGNPNVFRRCDDDENCVIYDGARRSLADFGYGDAIRYVKVGKEAAGNTLHGKQYLEFPELAAAHGRLKGGAHASA